MSSDLFRVYAEVGKDGYPPEWHAAIKHLVREQAENRCVRCGHPYTKGEGEWSLCDENCTHGGPAELRYDGRHPQTIAADAYFNAGRQLTYSRSKVCVDPATGNVLPPLRIYAAWRILTVHHLNGVKADCRWWNLASLCQRCHLRIQRTVVLPRVFPWEHTEWFKPYAAGWYAFAYLGEELTREETMERLDELLALEYVA